MSKLLLLFQKDASSKLKLFKQNKQQRDIGGLLSSVVLLCIIYGVFIYVFKAFAEMYLGSTFTDPSAGADRVYELLTFVYCAVFLINVLVGVRKIYNSLVENDDCDVLMCQPISARTIFLYKLIQIYTTQVISSLLILVPVSIVTDVLTVFAGGAGYYFVMLFNVLMVPLISCAVAALFSIPYTAIMRLIDSKFAIHLLLYIAVVAVGFWIYSKFLSVLTGLLNSGKIEFVFDRNTINILHGVALKLFPSNYFVNMLFGTKIWQSILIIIGVSGGAAVITYFVIQTMYNRILQRKMEGGTKVFNNKPVYKMRSVTATLLRKEFLVVLRTPSYAFQYFATSVTLPFMVYVCVNLMRSMMSTLTILDCDYELSIFVISMFSILTNTFCATNISRDGKMFAMLKTMPVRCVDIIRSKLIFCSIVSLVSVLASCITLAAVGYLNAWQTVFIFVMAMLLSLAEIAFATRKDLNSPNFASGFKDEVSESNSNISTVVLIGLFVSLLAGGGALALTTVLSLLYSAKYALIASIGIVAVIVVAAFVLSFVYLFRKLNKKYSDSEL